MNSKTKVWDERRNFMKKAGTATLAVPAVWYLGKSRMAHAEDLPKLTEDDATAVALKYVHDASQAKDRKDPTSDCANCLHYTGADGVEFGPCAIFPGKSVSAKGWCNVWAKKA